MTTELNPAAEERPAMAALNTIREALHDQPFRPFDLKLVNGSRYTVRHPNFVAIPPLERPREVVYLEAVNDGEDYRSRDIDLALVTEVVVPSEATTQPT